MQYKAIIFDFDGVIGRSEESRFSVFKNVFRSKGLILPDYEFKNMVGITTGVFLRNLQMNGLTENLKNEIREEYNRDYKANITKYVYPIAEVVDFIKNYKGELKLAVASGSDYRILQALLEHFEIMNKFEKLIGKEQVTKYKPHPEAYIVAAKALDVRPEECIVIEDSIVGAKAAIGARASCYIFLNGINKQKDFIDLPISGFLNTTDDFNKLSHYNR